MQVKRFSSSTVPVFGLVLAFTALALASCGPMLEKLGMKDKEEDKAQPAAAATAGAGVTATPTAAGETIASGDAVGVKLSAPAGGHSANECLKLTVTAFGAGGAAVKSNASLLLTLTDSSESVGAFYSDAQCANQNATYALTLPAGASTAEVYYTNLHPIAVSVGASGNGIASLEKWETTLGLATASSLQLDFGSAYPDDDGDFASGACIGPFMIYGIDSRGLPVIFSATAATAIALSAGLGDARFYAASDCSGSALNQLSIPADQWSTNEFYLRGTTTTNIGWSKQNTLNGINQFTFK